jgi:hypothetical protein
MLVLKRTQVEIYNFQWNKDNLYKLSQCLTSEENKELRQKMYEKMNNLEDVNIVADMWSQYFHGASGQAFQKKVCRTRKVNKAPWIDNECADMRQILAANGSLSQKESLKQYKCLLQKKKRQYKQNIL